MAEPDFYLRDPRALTRSVLADMNPCEYGRVSMLTDMSCEEYPFGVLEITLPALCKKWHMNARRAFTFLLKLRDEWKLIRRIEGKDGPLRIELSTRALRSQADGYDGRGKHDPIAQVNALSDEALLPPVKAQREREADADRQAWSRYKRDTRPEQSFTDADRQEFMAQRARQRQDAAVASPSQPFSQAAAPALLLDPESSDVTPAFTNVTPHEAVPVTPELTTFFEAASQPVTSRSSQNKDTTESETRDRDRDNNPVTPASHAQNSVTSWGVTDPVTPQGEARAEAENVVALLSDANMPYCLSVPVAQELVSKKGAAFCRQQLAWLSDREHSKGTLAGLLRRSIEEDYTEPPAVRERREEAARQEQSRGEAQRKREQATQRAQADQREREGLDARYAGLDETQRAQVDVQARATLTDHARQQLKRAEEVPTGGTVPLFAQAALDNLTRARRDILRQRTGETHAHNAQNPASQAPPIRPRPSPESLETTPPDTPPVDKSA